MRKMIRLEDVARNGRKRLALEDGEGVYVGLDVHKASYHIAFWAESQRRILTSFVMPADAQKVIRLLEPVRMRVRHVVYEAGPTGFSLARALRSAAIPADVIAPGLIPRTPVNTGKCDSIDAKKLAEMDGKGGLKTVAVPTEQEEADRALDRAREQIVKDLRRAKSRINGFLLFHGIPEVEGLEHWSKASVKALRSLELCIELREVLELLLDEYDGVIARLKKVDSRLRTLARKPRHASAIKRLRTVPGVGPVTAMTFRTELVRPERFATVDQVAQMIGLAPSVHGSGEEKRDAGLSQGGNRRLRTALIEAAWVTIRHDERARERYRRLVSNTGKSNKAITGVARWLGIVLWRMTLTGEDYRPVETPEAA